MKNLIGLSSLVFVGLACNAPAPAPTPAPAPVQQDAAAPTPPATAPTAVTLTPPQTAPAMPALPATPAMPAAPAMPGYVETEHDGRLYVTSSQATADKLAAGGELPMSVTKIGAGPNGQTLVIEASKDGSLEKALATAYAQRHP